MPPPTGAPLPPSLSGQPPMGASPMGMPTMQAGNAAAAMAQVRKAVEILQMALPQVPMGSKLHKAISESITKLSREAPMADSQPGVEQTTLRDLAQQQQQQAPMAALMRSMNPGAPPGQPMQQAA